jgi:hypothetical protein
LDWEVNTLAIKSYEKGILRLCFFFAGASRMDLGQFPFDEDSIGAPAPWFRIL